MSARGVPWFRSAQEIELNRQVWRAKALGMAKWTLLCAIAVALFGASGLLYGVMLRMDASFWVSAPVALAFCFFFHKVFDRLQKASFSQFDRLDQMQAEASAESERQHAIKLACKAALSEANDIQAAIQDSQDASIAITKTTSSARRL